MVVISDTLVKIREKMNSPMTPYALLILAIAVVVTGIVLYIYHSHRYPSTDDAYLHANTIDIAARVSGQVTNMPVSSYQYINKGDLLIQLDTIPFELALKQAKAHYQLALQQHQQESSSVAEAAARLESSRAQLIEAQRDYKRIKALWSAGIVAMQDFDKIKTTLATASSNEEAAKAALEQAMSVRGSKGKDAAVITQAAVDLAQAEINLSYTTISAPFDGFLGDINIHAGSVITARQPLFPLIEDNSFWLRGNFKETDIKRIKPGQSAVVVFDMYPDVEFDAVVAEISTASGASFSLLPPENATGNWIKTTQRFPIRLLLKPHKNQPQLRIGASANVTINTVKAIPQDARLDMKQSQ